MRHPIIVHALAALIALAPRARAQSAPTGSTTVILVRHAERAVEPAADPPLASAGVTRADALVELVKDAGIVAALGAPQPPDICDAGYDNVFVVTVPATGAVTVTRLHYGAVTPGCTGSRM